MNVLIACEESQEVCKRSVNAATTRTAATSRNVPAAIQNGISSAMC